MTARAGAQIELVDVAAVEGHALPRDAVEVGGFDQLRPIGPNGMRGMVVGEDEEDVGFLGCGWGETSQGQEREKEIDLHFYFFAGGR